MIILFIYTKYAVEKMDGSGIEKKEVQNTVIRGMKWKSEDKWHAQIQNLSKKLGLFGLAKKSKIAQVGNSIAIRIPKEIVRFLNLKKGKEVVLFPKNRHDLHIQV